MQLAQFLQTSKKCASATALSCLPTPSLRFPPPPADRVTFPSPLIHRHFLFSLFCFLAIRAFCLLAGISSLLILNTIMYHCVYMCCVICPWLSCFRFFLSLVSQMRKNFSARRTQQLAFFPICSRLEDILLCCFLVMYPPTTYRVCSSSSLPPALLREFGTINSCDQARNLIKYKVSFA